MNRRLLALLIMMAALSAPALAASADGAQQRVPTVTRLVQLFGTLESELMTAVQRGDSSAIDKMLADDFELRTGAMPGIPTPRAEWLQRSLGQAATPIEQMAAHDYGDVAVVSYLWQRGPRHDIFVVDVWKRLDEAWRLSVRYASPAGDGRFSIPGAGPQEMRIEKR